MTTPACILSTDLSYSRFDAEVRAKLKVINKLNSHYPVENYEDFVSIKLIDQDMLKDLFDGYVHNTLITSREDTLQALINFAPTDSFDIFLIHIILPIILNVGDIDLCSFIDEHKVFYNTTIRYDELIFLDNVVRLTFKCDL